MIKKIISYENISLSSLRTDLGTQSRYLVDPQKKANYEQAVRHYAEQMNYDRWRWQDSPPIVFGPVAYLGQEIYLPGDGHTRIESAKLAGYATIYCQVEPGGAVEALRYSLGPANRDYLSNKLDLSDIIYRIYLTLKDREMWLWVDRRILDYCDNGNRLVKLRKVALIRNQLLEEWAKKNPSEYEWRVAQLTGKDCLKDVDGEGVEFKLSYPGKQTKRFSTRVNPGDISRLAYTTAQFRAAQSGCSIEQWIESAVLLADSERAIEKNSTDLILYTYDGDTNCYPILDREGAATELVATISRGYQMCLVETITCQASLLPIRLNGCLWPDGYHLQVAIYKLK